MISRSRFPEDFEGLLQSVSTKRQARKRRRIMIKVIWVHQLIHRIQIALVDLFVKPAYKSLVRFGRHGRSLLPVNWVSHGGTAIGGRIQWRKANTDESLKPC